VTTTLSDTGPRTGGEPRGRDRVNGFLRGPERLARHGGRSRRTRRVTVRSRTTRRPNGTRSVPSVQIRAHGNAGASADIDTLIAQRVTVPQYMPGVLIVEDDPSVRSFLRTALEAEARVVDVEDGDRAMAVLRGRAGTYLDLVLADYRLPKRSGLDVLYATKRRWPWIPVVIITGFGSEELVVQAVRGGASDYLKKPIRLETLRRTVGALMNRNLMASVSSTVHRVTPAVHPGIRRALLFLHDHFADAITLTRLAREADLSKFHFCRLFHRETGMLLHDYLQELRVSRAKLLLADNYLTVTDVAYAVGFKGLSYFDKTFRKRVGRSPTHYRRRAVARRTSFT
jgi:YesN/AraC family two-component response regulator